jgi:hypothetical protein
MKRLVVIALVLGLVHFSSAAIAGWLTPSCMESSRDYHPSKCACIKGGYKSSLVSEKLLWHSAFSDKNSKPHRRMQDELTRLYLRCS